jgi:hypothetical protein
MKKSNIDEKESLLVFRSNSWVFNLFLLFLFVSEGIILMLSGDKAYYLNDLYPDNNAIEILIFILLFNVFICANWYCYLLLNHVFYRPFSEILRLEDLILIKQDDVVIERKELISIKEVIFIDRVDNFELRIFSSADHFINYHIAEDYLWGILFRNKRRKEHTRKIKKLFEGITITEYKNGKYLKI